jgi:hypothetical protein
MFAYGLPGGGLDLRSGMYFGPEMAFGGAPKDTALATTCFVRTQALIPYECGDVSTRHFCVPYHDGG